uniref:UDP-glucuronosyltransferase n=1 Tax=Timema douglasi TaxID=61478 RepID=A0A7R8ZCU7_TIMDO|nr:unnamed protein product [Timema douglasi]
MRKDLQGFMDDAPHGVIYMSLGTNLPSAYLPPEKIAAFIEIFTQLKQKVLWKWENGTLSGRPPNVKVAKWFPQQDILDHPNMRAFIFQGGLHSAQEALYHAVPVIGIPVLAEQLQNVRMIQKRGFGVLVDFFNLSSSSLRWALKEVLEDPRYKTNAQEASRLFRDQPETPLERAVYWTEYVIRHKGATHLRSASLTLSWYQYYLLDILLPTSALLLLVCWAVGAILLWALRKTWSILELKARRCKNTLFGISETKKK